VAVLQLVNVSKSFGAIRALSDISLNLHAGEAIGIAGDLGAGKSTLIKVIGGAVAHSSGMIVLDGEQVRLEAPADARRRGIEIVPQDPGLCGGLSAAANVFLGRELSWRIGPVGVLDRRAMNARAGDLFAEMHSDIGPRTLARELSSGQRRAVAIARTRLAQAKVVLLDEPNAVAGGREAAQTLDLIRQMRDGGVGVLLVSDALADLFAVCDRVLVLRRGRKVAELAVGDTSPEEIGRLLAGGVAVA